MSRLKEALHRDVTHKHIALTGITAAQRYLSCVQLLLLVGGTGL
jgi:hypothetical protein